MLQDRMLVCDLNLEVCQLGENEMSPLRPMQYGVLHLMNLTRQKIDFVLQDAGGTKRTWSIAPCESFKIDGILISQSWLMPIDKMLGASVHAKESHPWEGTVRFTGYTCNVSVGSIVELDGDSPKFVQLSWLPEEVEEKYKETARKEREQAIIQAHSQL